MICETIMLIIGIYILIIFMYSIKKGFDMIEFIIDIFVTPFNYLLNTKQSNKLSKTEKQELQILEKDAYLKKAKELVEKKGEKRAENDYEI